ncbi:MAG: SRPBCC family protein [Curvibacter sp.]
MLQVSASGLQTEFFPRFRPWLIVFGLTLLFSPFSWGEIVLEKNHHQYAVRVLQPVAASCTRVWSLLTDYDHLAQWVPDMIFSRRIIPSPEQPLNGNGRFLVAQTGRAHFLFFGRDIHVRLWVTELLQSQINMELADGDFEVFSAQYSLQPKDGQCELRYTALMKPNFFVPPLIGTRLFKQQLQKKFTAILQRAEHGPQPSNR